LVIKNPPFKSEGRIMAIKDIQGKMSIMDRLRLFTPELIVRHTIHVYATHSGRPSGPAMEFLKM
jgi:hypothetical protein